MANHLFIDYNALRLAKSLLARQGEHVRVFLFGDSVNAAQSGQKVREGHYNIEELLAQIADAGGAIGRCGSCLDSRGMDADMLARGCHRGSMNELTDWTIWADRVVAF